MKSRAPKRAAAPARDGLARALRERRRPAPVAAPRAAHSEKGERKRRDVMEATLRILAREGPRAVTHRAVAAEAGTSLRGTTYYFESRDALLEAALRHYAESAIARFDAIAEALGRDVPDALDVAASLLSASVLSDLADPIGGLAAELELVLEIARRPRLEAAYQAWQARLEAMLEEHARRLGSDRPALDARLALATLRGLEVEALARPSRPPTAASLKEVFARLLRAMSALERAG